MEDSPAILILDIWLPYLWKNKFLLLSTINYICRNFSPETKEIDTHFGAF